MSKVLSAYLTVLKSWWLEITAFRKYIQWGCKIPWKQPFSGYLVILCFWFQLEVENAAARKIKRGEMSLTYKRDALWGMGESVYQFSCCLNKTIKSKNKFEGFSAAIRSWNVLSLAIKLVYWLYSKGRSFHCTKMTQTLLLWVREPDYNTVINCRTDGIKSLTVPGF